ncbi:MAG: Gfo/Idh/MocA family oxidoreductase [Bacilli bacterium]|nr:Gfo/Idh/MocA family oxidoreductase [Bacilli bacterium]
MIRFGLVGASGIAKKFARDIAFVDNAKITAVSARSEEQANEYKEFYNVEYAFGSYEEMAKSDVIDAVYIATPHNFHVEHAILFLNNKKHVLVEKPITVNLPQYELMLEVAKKNNVLLMEAMWTHFLPSTRFIKKLVDSKELGNLKQATIEFGYELISDHRTKRRWLNPELAGGSILDMGVYPFSFYLMLQQSPIKSLVADAIMTYTGVDKTCNVEIIDDNGAKIFMRSSIGEEFENNAVFEFEKATIKMIDFSRSSEFYVNEKRYDMPMEGEGFVHEIRSFVETIENGLIENPIMTHKASRRSMKLLDEIRKAIHLKYPFE